MNAVVGLVALALVLGFAASPVRAGVPCNPDLFGPGTGYAGNLPNATDFVDTVLARGAELGPEDTLVVLDIDNTVLAMVDDLGSDQWYRWQKRLLAAPGPDAGEVAPDFDGMLNVQRFLFGARPMRLTQPDMAVVIRTLQQLGYPVVALTARGPNNIGATLRELARNGIDLGATAPPGPPGLAGAHPPLDPADPAAAGLTPAELDRYRLGVPRPVLYRDGVFMVAGQHKGAMLKILLHRLGRRYPAIVALDDRDDSVCEMAQAYADAPGQLTVYRYDHERLRAKGFLRDPARQAAASRDWQLISAGLPALCEAVPAACGRPAETGTAAEPPATATPVTLPDRPLRITTWNLEHMMSEAVFQDWVAACAPHGWDEGAARAAGKPVELTYCNAHSGRDWPCATRQEALALRTPAAFEQKVAALRARAAALDADIYAFQEVSDADAVARILPEGRYEILFAPAGVAMNVAFAVRTELAPAVAARQIAALSVCALEDRMDPSDPTSCRDGSYRTRPGLELTLNTGDRTVALLNVHLKSSCRNHPVDDPPIDTLTARACASPGFDQAQANAAYRVSVARGCALLRDQVPAVEAWVEAQATAGHDILVLGDFNRNFVNELRRRMPARLDGTDPREPILPGTEIGSVLKEVSDNRPDGTYLYLARQSIDGRARTCRAPDGGTYEVRSCHQGIDHFLIGKFWAEAVSDNPRRITSTGADYGDGAYCAGHARPSDHCPVTLEIALATVVPAASTVPAPPAVPSSVQPVGAMPLPPGELAGRALRAWLKQNWFDGRHEALGYNNARRAMYSSIDVAADGRVYGVYSGFSQPAADTTFLDPINAEHTVPQGWFGRADPMRSDIHHLFPTHKDVNNARDSDPFGEIPDGSAATWYGLRGDGRLAVHHRVPGGDRDAFSEDRHGEFEPREGHEGDLARAVFYFYTMYPGRARSIEQIAKDGLDVLHRWHLQDPPDAWERQRNDRVALAQGNRNPYIDHPALVCRAWGLECPP